jgi:hypothetical protein
MSQRHKQQSVRIANPVPGGRNWTSAKMARTYVRAQRAVWVDEGRSIKFVALAIHAAVGRRLLEVRIPVVTPYDYAANVGIASLDAIRHLPTARSPELVLVMPTRRTVSIS